MKLFKKTKDKKLGWKVCFIIFLFVYINSYILIGFSINLGIKFLINLTIAILGIIAFFCFAWNKKILNKLFWQIAFISGIIWSIGSFTFFATSFNLWNELTFSDIMFLTPFMISHIYFPLAGLYYYAFRNDIWNR